MKCAAVAAHKLQRYCADEEIAIDAEEITVTQCSVLRDVAVERASTAAEHDPRLARQPARHEMLAGFKRMPLRRRIALCIRLAFIVVLVIAGLTQIA